jgi:hypothetical protein
MNIKKMGIEKKLPAHEGGSGHIFADLALPNAEEHELKAALVVELILMLGGLSSVSKLS